MLNIAICDDDVSITGKIDMLLERIKKEKIIDTEVFWDGKDLVESVEQGSRYDIIFLDIEMEKEDGITAAKKIRQFDTETFIIYVTSHESYMKSSFDVRPFRFLVKPVDRLELKKCFLEAYDEILKGDFYFRYRYERINYKIAIREILYFESQKRKIFIVTEKGRHCMYGKLNDVEKQLENCRIPFLRIHQSYLVNYTHIERLAYDYVMINKELLIPISEDKRKAISQQYCMMGDMFSV